MTSKHPSNDQWPLPLITKKGELGDAVRAYAHDTGETNGEADSYARVMVRMEGRSRRAPSIRLGVAVGALAGVAGLFLVLGPSRNVPSATNLVANQPSAMPVVPSRARPAQAAAAAERPQPIQVVPPVPSLHLGDQPAPLPTGESEIAGQAKTMLSGDAVASGISRDDATDITLQRGSIELHVLPQPPGHRLAVIAGRYRFTVVGTVFTVSRIQSRLELRVQEGAVAVSRGTRRLAVVRAGSRWNAEDEPTPPPAPPPPMPSAMAAPGSLVPSYPVATQPSPGSESARPPAVTQTPKTVLATEEDCRQLVATHRAQEAVGCYQKQAMRNGLAGETAAYELARLWRDTLGQPDRALAAFESQRSRFPAGTLRREADLSVIEILPRLGRHAEALVESQRFLVAYPGDERKGELHLLRGNIYREALRDLEHAQLEYALGASAKGRAGDDSQFFQAVCLEALGKIEEARQAYRAYLRQRGAVHAAEAKNRLAGLAP